MLHTFFAILFVSTTPAQAKIPASSGALAAAAEKKICKRETIPGTKFRSRVCLTASQWIELNRQEPDLSELRAIPDSTSRGTQHFPVGETPN